MKALTAIGAANDPPRNTIIVRDALRKLRKLEPGSIDTVLTSPPYLQL